MRGTLIHAHSPISLQDLGFGRDSSYSLGTKWIGSLDSQELGFSLYNLTPSVCVSVWFSFCYFNGLSLSVFLSLFLCECLVFPCLLGILSLSIIPVTLYFPHFHPRPACQQANFVLSSHRALSLTLNKLNCLQRPFLTSELANLSFLFSNFLFVFSFLKTLYPLSFNRLVCLVNVFVS